MSNTSSRSNSLIPFHGKQFDIISESGSIASSEGPFDLGNVIELAIRMDAHVLPSLLELGENIPIVEPIAVAVLVFYESYDLMQQHKDTLDKRRSILSQGTHLADHVMAKVNFANIGQYTSSKLVAYSATYSENEEMRPATPGSPYLAGKELETAIIEVQNAPSNFEPPPQPVMASQLMEWEFDEMKSRMTHAAMIVCDAGAILFDAKWSSYTHTKKYARINECIDKIQKCTWNCTNLIRDVDSRIKKAMDENKIPHKFVERTRYSVTRLFALNTEEKARLAEHNQQLNLAVIEFIRSITKWNSLFYVSEREKDPKLLQIKEMLKATTFDSLVKQHLKTYKYRKDWLHNEVVGWLSVTPQTGNQEVVLYHSDRNEGSSSSSSSIDGTSNRNRLFWYRASEGMGKSVFTAALVDRLNRYYPGQMLGCVFFKFNHTQQSHPSVVLRSLLYQLVRNLPELTECVLAGLDDRTQLNVELLQRVYCDALALLSELRASVNACGNTVLVLDALDEVYSVGTQERLSFLAWLSSFLASLPEWVKVFVTSRQQTDLLTVLTPFINQRRYSIDESDPRHLRDVQFYLNHIVVQTIPTSLTPELGYIASKEATALLLKKCEGTFLYLSIVEDRITALFEKCKQPAATAWTVEDYQEFLVDLPDGVSMAYMQMFNHLFKTAPLVKGMELLQILVCVQEILTQAELEDLLLMESVYSDGMKQLIKHFKEMFPLRDSVDGSPQQRFNASHRVLCDWLTNPALSGAYYCNPIKGHNLIAKRLLQKLQVECRLSEGCAALQDPEALSQRLSVYLSLSPESCAIKHYLFRHLLTHLDYCMDSDPKLRMLSYYLLTSPVWLRCHVQYIGLTKLWKECSDRVNNESWLRESVECREDLQSVERCLSRILSSKDEAEVTTDSSQVALYSDSSVAESSIISDEWLDSVCDKLRTALEETREIRRLNQEVVEAPDEEEADY